MPSKNPEDKNDEKKRESRADRKNRKKQEAERELSPIRRSIEQRNWDGMRRIYVGTICRQPVLDGLVSGLENFHHESIYMGQDRVIEADGMLESRLSQISAEIINYVDYLPPWPGCLQTSSLSNAVNDTVGEVVIDRKAANRALSRLNEGWGWTYHITRNNCQHFASWCKNREFYSPEAGTPVNNEDRLSENFEWNDKVYRRWGPRTI